MTDLRQRAKSLIGQGHVSGDIGEVMEQLLKVTVELERQASSSDQSGDVRILKTRNEQLLLDSKRKEAEFNAFKKNFLDIVIAEIRNISSEVAKINAAVQPGQDVVQASAHAIGHSLQSLATSLAKT